MRTAPLFQLDDLITIHLDQAKTKDFYCLVNKKTHRRCQTGPTKWNQTTQLDREAWKKKIFASLKNTCKETKLKEFQFKPIHRIVVTKKELFRYGIKTDDECLYCSEHDSVDHTFVDCEFVNNFVKMSSMGLMLLIIRNLLQQWMKKYLVLCPAHMIKHY